jgi:hypothetical protein
MSSKKLLPVLSSMAVFLTLSGGTCDESDECVAAKKHMCDKIPDMNCYAAFMDNAQAKIVNACGQAELDAYIPAVQAACSANRTDMDCDAVAGKKYADSDPDAGAGAQCDGGVAMKFSYSGTATADGRSAELEFSLSGTAVTGGRLQATAVCGSNIQLPRTDVSFTGSLSGTWESATGSIAATWTGGESSCDGTKLTAAAGYPTSGSLTIKMVGGKVQLLRAISDALPYEFTATNKTYAPSTTCADAGVAGKSGSSGSSAGTGGSIGGRGGSSSGTGGCAALQACCNSMTDEQMKKACNMAASGYKNNDQMCSDGLKGYQTINAC